MPGTGVGLIVVDFVFRPFAKIIEKMPVFCIFCLIVLYAAIAYVVLRSAYKVEDPYL